MTTGATPHGVSTHDIPPGAERVADVIASRDWASTPLGPREDWPAELRSLLRVLLTSRFSMWLGWGPDLAFFYNDAYRRDTLGTKHPWALGRPAREVWAEAWDDLAPRIEQVMAEGRSTWDQALELRLERGDSPEETYHTFSYSPITGDDGAVLGLFCVVTEETHRVIGARRMATLRRLGGDLAMQLEEDEMLRALGGSLASNTRDLPFTCVYVSEADGVARLAGTSGITPGAPGAPEVIAGDAPAWPLPSGGGPLVVDDLRDRFGDLPTGEWDRPPSRAVVVPLVMRAGDPPLGWFVAGMNPLRPLDQEALGWVELVAGRIAGSLATVRAYAGERRRAEALAELDRAKTTFFSDISHELRTPLTLMSGPLQQATQRPELPDDLREQLGFAYRGSGRLLKLVNTLLEFARIEAGRVDARFEPIELAAFTEDIASAFRSGAETMGLRMTVACAPLGEPVFVDPEMWEKIVSNLLSNALKFTHEGEVHVALALEDADAVLRVRDTGIGIAPDDLPELFRRFHRVRGAEGRTHEGSGIGLALVSELAQLHGGRAGVRSRPGAGSEFEVRIPRGRAHIPDEHLAAAPAMRDGVTTQQFVQEVLSWADDPDPAPEFPGMPVADARAAASGRILVADDNADMRAYLTRLLGSHYEVRALANGHDVLRAAMDDPPDLIVSDVMMPRVDGLEMVRRLRANPRTARIPVMLLSARAGVEASEEGLDSGADDYLLKPFSARELLARVGAHMALGRARREAEDQERAARERIEDLQARTARDEQRLRLLATASTTCLWGTDAAGVVTEPSPSWEEFTGQATSEYLGPDRGWLDAFDGPDRERLTHWFTGPARPRDAVARLRHADGTHRRVRLHAVPVTAEGAVGEWIASATDVEDELLLREEHERQHLELRVAQAQIAQATAAGRVGVWTWEMAGDHITADPVFAQILGLEAGGAGPVATSVVRLLEAVHPEDRDAVHRALRESVRTGTDHEAEFRVHGAHGELSWVLIRGSCERDTDGTVQRVSGVAIDITGERGALERLELLARAGEVLTGSRDLQRTLMTVADLVSPFLADYAVFDLIEDGTVVKVAGRHASVARRDFALQAAGYTPPLNHPHHPAAAAMRTGQEILVHDVTDAWIERIAVSPAHADFLRSLEISSFLCVPLLVNDGVIGALSLVFSGSGRRHGSAEVRVARELAGRSAVAIENAHLFSRVELARRRAEALTREQARLLVSEREALSRARLLERNAIHLAAALTVEDVCRTTADDLEAFGLDVVAVEVLDDAGTPEWVASVGVALTDMEDHRGTFRPPPDERVPGGIRRGARLEFPRRGDADAPFPAPAEAFPHRILTSIAIPLMDSGGRSVGAVYAGSRQGDWLTDERRAVLHGTAQQCGLALERARLHQAERRSRLRSELIGAVLTEMEARVSLTERAEAMLDALVPRIADAGAVLHARPGRGVVAMTRLEPGEMAAVDDPDAHGWVTVPLGEAGIDLLLGMRHNRDAVLLRDLDLLHDLSARAGLALQTARLRDEEHQVAVELQRSLLPARLDTVEHVVVQARYHAAERLLEVGGDWYDTLRLPDGRIGLCVGDVVGHDLQAGIVMGQLRTALLTHAAMGDGPAGTLSRLDEVAARIEGAQLTTVCYAELDPADGTLVYACAGHPPPLVVDVGGAARFLWDGRSTPLGGPRGGARTEGRTRMAPGSRLVLYSDGLVERRFHDIDDRFAALARVAAEAGWRSQGQFCDVTIARMTAGASRDDDLALLCAEFRPRVGAPFARRFPARMDMLSTMRRALDEWGASLGIERREGMVLACSEACSNAVEHAYRGTDAGEVSLEAVFDGRAVQMTVRDDGSWRPPEPNPERGRGLIVVRAVADEVSVQPGEDGTTLVARVPITTAPPG